MSTTYVRVVDRPIESVEVPSYTTEEHETWKLLLAKQSELVHGRACQEFIEGLHQVDFPSDRIPLLREVSARIEAATSWRLVRVDGLVHPKDFFALLARRVFPSTDFIRRRQDIDYTPEPDLFHDLFGHAPLLTNPDFTEFFQAFGEVGVRAHELFEESHPIHEQISRLYWFTVEFGLIQAPQGIRAYGSGSVSSPKELLFCTSPSCTKLTFDIPTITQKTYDIWHLQEEVFVIDSFPQLGRAFRAWARSQNLLTG